ncbi:hypothetical protein ACHAWF_006911 [Thalassiosira exigua]
MRGWAWVGPAEATTKMTESPAALDQVVAAVGQHLFSYLPTGSLLCGSSSPLLVNRNFHGGVYRSLGQSETLSLSCRHLRVVDDEQLINLIRRILENSEGSNTKLGQNDAVQGGEQIHLADRRGLAPLKVATLDLSRCRSLRGEGVYYCLKHMPDVRRILLSSAARFDARHHFSNDLDCDELNLSKLEYVDFAGCSLVDTDAMLVLSTIIMGCKLRHLDLSGASAQLNDSMLGAVAPWADSLESLNLSGAKKVTEYGVGLVSYLCRGTLKSLNLRGCQGVCLPALLAATSYDIMTLVRENTNDNRQAILPRNFVGNPESLSTDIWFSALQKSMDAFRSMGGYRELVRKSRHNMKEYKCLEKEWKGEFSLGERKEGNIFGRLENLDIGLIDQTYRIWGCLATIAWLNGGRLRQIDLTGGESLC